MYVSTILPNFNIKVHTTLLTTCYHFLNKEYMLFSPCFLVLNLNIRSVFTILPLFNQINSCCFHHAIIFELKKMFFVIIELQKLYLVNNYISIFFSFPLAFITRVHIFTKGRANTFLKQSFKIEIFITYFLHVSFQYIFRLFL